MQKFPIINENISKNDSQLYENIRKIAEFIKKYAKFLDINEKIVLEATQTINSIDIILRGVLKASSKEKDIIQHNKKSKTELEKCLTVLECAKIEIIKEKISNFDKHNASKIIGATEGLIRDIENHSPRILELIEEIQLSFVQAINGEKKVEKSKSTSQETKAKTIETINSSENIETINEDDWKNKPVIIKSENELETIPEEIAVTIKIEDYKTPKKAEIIDPDLYFKEFDSRKIDDIKNFFEECHEKHKEKYFVEYLNNYFKSLNILDKLNLIDFLIDKGLDKQKLREELFTGLRNEINYRNEKQIDFYTAVSLKLRGGEKRAKNTTEQRIYGQNINSQGDISNLSKKVEDIQKNVEKEITSDAKKGIRIIQKREDRIENTTDNNKLIKFINEFNGTKKEFDDFFKNFSYTDNGLKKAKISAIVINKINSLLEELDYKKIYYILELCDKLDIFVNFSYYKIKFIELSLQLSKQEKNTKLYSLFLEKYILNK